MLLFSKLIHRSSRDTNTCPSNAIKPTQPASKDVKANDRISNGSASHAPSRTVDINNVSSTSIPTHSSLNDDMDTFPPSPPKPGVIKPLFDDDYLNPLTQTYLEGPSEPFNFGSNPTTEPRALHTSHEPSTGFNQEDDASVLSDMDALSDSGSPHSSLIQDHPPAGLRWEYHWVNIQISHMENSMGNLKEI
jgi:hypothetical protein